MELARTFRAQHLEGAIPLEELIERVRAGAAQHRDHPGVVLGTTCLNDDGTWCYGAEAGWLTPHALIQLCARLTLLVGGTIPASYLTRCPGPLAARNLNHWLGQPAAASVPLFVRTRLSRTSPLPTVRAVLSRRYAVADHLPLLEHLLLLLTDSRLRVEAWSLDDERLTLRRLLHANHPVSGQAKDPLEIGVHIENSEVGLSRVSIHAYVHRVICANGLVVKVADLGGIDRRHFGRAEADLYAMLRFGLSQVLAEAEEAGRRFVALRQQPVPRPVDAYLRRAAWEAELPNHLVPEAMAALEGDSLYDMVNALTGVAQHLPVADRLRIESALSRYLRHPIERH